ncbi:P-loop ATPase, Sll1717 family [Spirulina subsalsa]|uniref:P-loop ATPase, Sll1717 family n=1 Tax=Spirulina subsalsa TaxID=54311 RepID=UPI0002E47727|nr:hypothetical protein [Spirulina subsalsa]
MNYLEIKDKIEQNMLAAHLKIEDLRIQQDEYTGWRIVVISSDFAEKAHSERQKIVLNGLESLTIQWLDLLTPQEQEWAGSLPLDAPLENLPLWPEALESFKEIDRQLEVHQKSWREFWLIQMCLACYLSWSEEKPRPNEALDDVLSSPLKTELDLINWIENLLQKPKCGLLMKDWLMGFDQAASDRTFLLIDGLDTGFGSGKLEQAIRTKSIANLLSLINDLEYDLTHFKFKVMLREDIWRRLRFENKSHFFGRSVTLQWSESVDFFKVIAKTALQANTFKLLVQSLEEQHSQGRFLFHSDDFNLTEQQVWNIWNLLVGERMRGGKSAFTRNWVWKRIADGSNNHSPRALLQLFAQAKDWERGEQEKNSYGKTVIRPKALIVSLEEVSRQSLDALIQEEFPNLGNLVECLRQIGRSPFKANEVEGLEDELSLAIEVGLLSVYEGTNDEVERYKVPDLYLSGIGMTRKGQARAISLNDRGFNMGSRVQKSSKIRDYFALPWGKIYQESK